MAQRGESRRQQHQLIAQQLHQAIGAAQAWRVEIQMPAHTFQRADFAQELHLPTMKILFGFFGTDDGACMGGQ
ncbi:hypothetical protein D3C81_1826630 [compost metagenome]